MKRVGFQVDHPHLISFGLVGEKSSSEFYWCILANVYSWQILAMLLNYFNVMISPLIKISSGSMLVLLLIICIPCIPF